VFITFYNYVFDVYYIDATRCELNRLVSRVVGGPAFLRKPKSDKPDCHQPRERHTPHPVARRSQIMQLASERSCHNAAVQYNVARLDEITPTGLLSKLLAAKNGLWPTNRFCRCQIKSS